MTAPARYPFASNRRRWPTTARAIVLVVSATGLGRPAAAQDTFQCALKQSAGVAQADAETAARLLCDELRKEAGARGAFEVTFGTLGKAVLVTAMRSDSRFSVTIQVDGLEELTLAAGRVAKALVQGQPFSSTERVDNLIRSEARESLSKKGSVKFSLGIADVETPGHGARGSGLVLGLTYNTPRVALPAEMRFGWDNEDYRGKQLRLFSVSVGGRAYLSTRDWSPFAGGGVGYLNLRVDQGDYLAAGAPYFSGERSGVVPYVEAGVELLRTHRGRVALQVRADLPTGSVRSARYEIYTWDERAQSSRVEGVVPERSRYVAPVTIGISVTF